MATYIPPQLKDMASMRRHHMMIRSTPDTSSGYTAYFYDKVTDKYVGETAIMNISDNVYGNSTPVRKYPVSVYFNGQTYENAIYEK